MSQIKRLMVNQNASGRPEALKLKILAGYRSPNGNIPGILHQWYMRAGGDYWLNVNGNRRWLKMLEM